MAKALAAIMLMIAVALFVGCKPEEINPGNFTGNNNGNQPTNDTTNNNGNQPTNDTTLPRVVTSAVFDITATQASGGGVITADGGSDIVERGLCWGIAVHPDVSGDHAYDSLGLGTFTILMTDLIPETTYYVRAYAINGKGIGYGEQVSFRTLALPEPPEPPAPYTEADFVGIWGVERIEYYNTDYWGNPIPGSMQTYLFTPGDPEDGIDLVYWEDHTGELRDRSRDTIYLSYDQYIVCPDTILITGFSYSYIQADSLLFMTMETQHPITYRMFIPLFTDDSFVYENEYDSHYVEKAYMKRLSYVPDKSRSINTTVTDRTFEKRPLLRR